MIVDFTGLRLSWLVQHPKSSKKFPRTSQETGSVTEGHYRKLEPTSLFLTSYLFCAVCIAIGITKVPTDWKKWWNCLGWWQGMGAVPRLHPTLSPVWGWWSWRGGGGLIQNRRGGKHISFCSPRERTKDHVGNCAHITVHSGSPQSNSKGDIMGSRGEEALLSPGWTSISPLPDWQRSLDKVPECDCLPDHVAKLCRSHAWI